MAVINQFESPAVEYASLNELNLNQLLVGLRQHSTFFCSASGDGLRSRGIYDGDLLIADRSLTARNGDVVIAMILGEFALKTFKDGFLYSDFEKPVCLGEEVLIEAVLKASVRQLRPFGV